ncbi:MAG TPA: hypothetical protein VHZ24_09360 [Pirellulales bacterium]|nr:hypothetical protein [Pirellulales bacterium]
MIFEIRAQGETLLDDSLLAMVESSFGELTSGFRDAIDVLSVSISSSDCAQPGLVYSCRTVVRLHDRPGFEMMETHADRQLAIEQSALAAYQSLASRLR